MGDEELNFEEIYERRKNRFRILVCVDGSDESYRGLRYAAHLGQRDDADIILLYVRPVDQGMRTGGLQVRVARENMLSWGLELPGIKYLNKGRDLLFEGSEIADEWGEKITHTDVVGDPLGDNKVEYTNVSGKSVVLKLKVAPTIASGILDQYELGPYNLIIIGTSGSWGGWAKALLDPAVAEKVVVHAPCTVLVTRELERKETGYLLCTDGSERSMEMVSKIGDYVTRTHSNISVMSVALDVESEPEAQDYVDKAVELLRSLDINPTNCFTRVGNPVDEIIDAGKKHSIIALGDTGKTGLKRFFLGSVAFKVMEHADNSVMIVR